MAATKGKPIWEGAISFGLVTIPVRLFSAVRDRGVELRYVHNKDMAPISKQAVCAQGHTVPWSEVIRAYEYKRGEFIPIEEGELEDAQMSLTQTVDIIEFVNADDIHPIYFQRPYYTEPQKGADKTYAMLRDALVRKQKVGIARVRLTNREHIAAVMPRANMLVVGILHYEEELKNPERFRTPGKVTIGSEERQMADEVIERLTANYDPEKYTSRYKAKLLEQIHRGIKKAKTSKREPAFALKESLTLKK